MEIFRGNKYKVSINSDIDYLVNYSVCAFKIGLLLQMNIKNIIKGISLFKPAPSRMERITRGKHIVINDCYNASYETMISGLDYFEKQPVKDKIVILGDILELGLQSSKIHMDIAKYIAKKKFNFDEIHLVGPEMKCVYTYLNKKGFNVRYYKKVEAVSKAVLRGKSAYLKASHGIGLYKLLEKD